MLPIKAGTPLFSRPVATLALIVANVSIYFLAAPGGPRSADDAFRYGLVPREFFSRAGVTYLFVADSPVAAIDAATATTRILDPRLEGTTFGERLKRTQPEAFEDGPVRIPYVVSRHGPFFGVAEGSVLVEPVRPALSPWAAIFSSMFLHGGLLHLLGNMWFLWLFGPSVEDVLGRGRFLGFYFLGGIAAAAAQVADDPASLVPCVGASGAIAGVMGGFLILFPRSEVLTLVPLMLGGLLPLPAFLFLGFYLVEQIVMSLSDQAGGVAWWAHIGGFVAGMATIRRFGTVPGWAYAFERRRPSGKRFGYDYGDAPVGPYGGAGPGRDRRLAPYRDEDDDFRR